MGLAIFVGDPRWIVQIQNRILARSKLNALVLRRQKSVTPKPSIKRLAIPLLRDEHDERGQVVVFATETVVDPRSDRRTSGKLRTSLDECSCRIVVDGLGVHRFDEADLVDDFGMMRKQIADPGSGFAVLAERKFGSRHRKGSKAL